MEEQIDKLDKIDKKDKKDQESFEKFKHYVVLCFTFFAFAFYMNIIGSTLDDLSIQLNCKVQEISFALSARTIVNFLSGVLATFTIHYFNRQLQLIFHLIIYALTSGVLPFIHSITYFYIQSIISGISMAYINSIVIQWAIELYSDDSKKLKYYLQLIYFMFPLASFVSIQSTAPFLSKKLENNTIIITSSERTKTESRIDIPFYISAILSLSCAIIILYLFLKKPYEYKERKLDGKDRAKLHLRDEEDSPIPKSFYYLVTGLFLGCCAFQLGQESNSMYYTHNFLLKTSLKLSKSTAAYVTSIIYASYGLGRFINIFISMKARTSQMIYLNITMMLIANIMIYFFIEYNILICYIAFAILGFSYSSMLPSLITFFEQRLNMTQQTSTLMVAFGTTVATLNHLIVGEIIERNYNIYRIMSFLYTTIFAFIFIALHLTDFLKRKILRNQKITIN